MRAIARVMCLLASAGLPCDAPGPDLRQRPGHSRSTALRMDPMGHYPTPCSRPPRSIAAGPPLGGGGSGRLAHTSSGPRGVFPCGFFSLRWYHSRHFAQNENASGRLRLSSALQVDTRRRVQRVEDGVGEPWLRASNRRVSADVHGVGRRQVDYTSECHGVGCHGRRLAGVSFERMAALEFHVPKSPPGPQCSGVYKTRQS